MTKRQGWIKGSSKLEITPNVDLPTSDQAVDLSKFLDIEVTVIDRRTRSTEKGISIKSLVEKYS